MYKTPLTRLGPTCTDSCVRSITYNAVTSGTHTSQSVQEKDEHKILLDFNQKQKEKCQITDFTIPGDQNIAIKEQEKIDKYQDLRKELQKV